MPSLGIDRIREIRHGDLETLGIRATPTLLIVDGKGAVQSAWTGKLNLSQEKEVFAKLAVHDAPRPPMAATAAPAALQTVAPSDLRALLSDPQTVVVDGRDRAVFEQALPKAPLEICLPAPRGLMAKFASAFPSASLRLMSSFLARGRKAQRRKVADYTVCKSLYLLRHGCLIHTE